MPEASPANAFVAAVGSFRPDMAGLPAAPTRSANRVVVDLEGAREEAGDLIQAVRAWALRWENALPLEDVFDTGPLGSPVVFESVGNAL